MLSNVGTAFATDSSMHTKNSPTIPMSAIRQMVAVSLSSNHNYPVGTVAWKNERHFNRCRAMEIITRRLRFCGGAVEMAIQAALRREFRKAMRN